MSRTTVWTSLGAIPLLFLGAACGKSGGHGSATATDPSAPVISNQRVSFGGGCTLPRSVPGTIENLAFDYIDADGNGRGGTIEDTTTAAVGSATNTVAIPSPSVTITGTTSGTVIVTFCDHFGSNTSARERIKITDASGNESNELTIELTRPGGAPLLAHDADPALRMAPEFRQ
jgi:hypothetical protein